jgi:hypothetical protein
VLMGLALARKMMMAEVGEGAPNSLLGAIAAVIAVS